LAIAQSRFPSKLPGPDTAVVGIVTGTFVTVPMTVPAVLVSVPDNVPTAFNVWFSFTNFVTVRVPLNVPPGDVPVTGAVRVPLLRARAVCNVEVCELAALALTGSRKATPRSTAKSGILRLPGINAQGFWCSFHAS